MSIDGRKILINAITLDNANLIPLLLKVKVWQELGAQVTFLGNRVFLKKVNLLQIADKHDFILFESEKTDIVAASSRMGFTVECLRRNIRAISYLKKLKGRFDLVYSISSVLDLVLLPFFLKKADKNIKWATVFDNTVPLFSDKKIFAGNKLVRMLAWLFFKISLFFLKKADFIFTVSEDLKNYLVKNGFSKERVKITGVGLETDLIKSARKDEEYNFDAIFVGRINEAKGIFDLLRIVEIIKKETPNFSLAIMGDGDKKTKKALASEISRKKLGESICLLGYKTGQEKFNLIKSSKCFLFPSHTESVGIALLEAVCMGKKAFAYNLDAYKIYQNNEVELSSPGDFEDMAKSVMSFIKSGVFKDEDRRDFMRKFSWDKIARREAEAFDLICQKIR